MVLILNLLASLVFAVIMGKASDDNNRKVRRRPPPPGTSLSRIGLRGLSEPVR